MSRTARTSRPAHIASRTPAVSRGRGRHARPTRALRLALSVACLAAGGTAAVTTATGVTLAVTSSPASALTMGEQAVVYAAQEVGKPYQYGATGPNSFDCSGFTSYVYRRLGVNLPRTSGSQYAALPKIAQGDKQPGDLIFFYSGGSIYHVGIYAGDNQMWAAPSSGGVVQKQAIYSPYYYVGRPWTGPAPMGPDEAAIMAHAEALRARGTDLGAPTSPYTAVPGGAYVNFAGGAITSDGNGGRVYETHGDIRTKWGALGFERGRLGFPTSDVSPSNDGIGTYSNFQGGAISWSPATGARATWGPTREAWMRVGLEFGPLAYPTSDETPSVDGRGYYTNFQGGAISWSATTGAYETHGPVREAWAASNFEFGVLGYPTSDVTPVGDGAGVYSNFQGGAITWTARTGAQLTTGPIRAAWAASGFEAGRLGYPAAPQVVKANGVLEQRFERGVIRYDPATGATRIR